MNQVGIKNTKPTATSVDTKIDRPKTITAAPKKIVCIELKVAN
jgi:hypothetical protein